MKKLIILTVLVLGTFAFQTVNAQVRVNINIGSQPLWGPVGYDRADYYYLPDVESYYNINTQQFIYPDRGRWITATALPPRFGRVNMYTMHKVVINNTIDPYRNHNYYRTQYGKYRGMNDQVAIRDSRDRRYSVVKGHHMYRNNNSTTVINNTTVINRGNNNGYQARDNGRHKGWDKRNGRR